MTPGQDPACEAAEGPSQGLRQISALGMSLGAQKLLTFGRKLTKATGPSAWVDFSAWKREAEPVRGR
jgi:hypothetical protein